jgi:hypothetical protein
LKRVAAWSTGRLVPPFPAGALIEIVVPLTLVVSVIECCGCGGSSSLGCGAVGAIVSLGAVMTDLLLLRFMRF